MALDLDFISSFSSSPRRQALVFGIATDYRDGRHEKALTKAKVLLQEDFDSGLLESSLIICNEILILMPNDPTALFFAGKILKEKNQLEQAWDRFKTLSITFPHNLSYFALASDVAPSHDHRLELEKIRHQLAGLIADFPNRPALELVESAFGSMVLPLYPNNDVISKTIKDGKIYDKKIVDEAHRFIRSGTACIDIGANFGQMSLIFSTLVGESGMVYSVEADDYCSHIIKKNIELNTVKNIYLITGAAHKLNNEQVIFPEQDFNEFGTYGSYGISPKSTEGRKVNTVTIDSLKISQEVSFMKVDVQGADLWALQGSVQTIHKYKFPIIFEYEEQFQESFDSNFGDYVDFVNDINYKFVKTIDAVNFLIMPR